MEIDYQALGQRIRRKRTLLGLSQEKLAELSGLSVPHMNHVETGRTKVSLPALVSIANALGTQMDELLCDSVMHSKVIFQKEISDTLSDCDERETRLIADVVKALKLSYRRLPPGR